MKIQVEMNKSREQSKRKLIKLKVFFRKTNVIDTPLEKLTGEGREGEDVNKQNMSERTNVQLYTNKLVTYMNQIKFWKNVKVLKVAQILELKALKKLKWNHPFKKSPNSR